MKLNNEKNEEKFRSFFREHNIFYSISVKELISFFKKEEIEIIIPKRFYEEIKMRRFKK